jgi:predicted RNA-binding Zn-ribbon protein involved in translation (DUF1610 family)
MQPEPIQATVDVIVEADRHSRFGCPNCGKTIRYQNAYPLSFQWKVCPGCRLQWIPGPIDIGPRADDIAGTTQRLMLYSSGRAV